MLRSEAERLERMAKCPHGKCASESCAACGRVGVKEYMEKFHPLANIATTTNVRTVENGK